MPITSVDEVLRSTAHDAADSVADAVKPVANWIDEKKQYACDQHEQVAKYVSAHPIRSLGGMLVAGILIGRFL